MACNSLLSFNSSSSLNHLRSNHSFLLPNSSSSLNHLRSNHSFLLPSPPIISLPSSSCHHRRRRRCRLIISEMESAKTEPTPQSNDEVTIFVSSGDKNSLAPTSIASGQKLMFISAANIPTWAKLVLGSIVLLAIPFCRKALRIKDITKTVEEVAEVVEMVAEVTEKLAEGIAEALPDGSSLKEAAIRLEKIAFFVDKQAEITETFITKVDDAVEVLDTTLKPLFNGEEKIKNEEENMITATKLVETSTPKLKVTSDKLGISNEL